MKSIITIFILGFVQFTTFGQCTEQYVNSLRKTAIVIGESNYKFADVLNNPVHDAEDVSICLKRLGFEVSTFKDIDRSTMISVIDSWCNQIKKGDISIFYYSGHGAEINEFNYICPIDLNPIVEADIKYNAYPTDDVIRSMTGAGAISIVVLDACRNNPFIKKVEKSKRTLSPSHGGLAKIEADLYNSVFIAFATSKGETVDDGSGRNGDYTAAFIKNIEQPNLKISDIFDRISSDIKRAFPNRKPPYKDSSLDSDTNICLSVKAEIPKTTPKLERDNLYSNNINFLLHNIDFGSSLSDVINYEYGTANKTPLTYESLPTATECKNENIKYFWRYLNESKMSVQIYGFLASRDLLSSITKDSYIVYAFKDNRLVRISLRIYSNNAGFKYQFLNAIGQNTIANPDKYQTEVNSLHFVTGQSFTDGTFTEVFLCNEIGYNICSFDWWHKQTN